MTQRIVIKLGTNVLTAGGRGLDRAQMVDLVRQVAALHRHDKDVIIVTSGAIAAGRERLGFPDLPATIATKQMLAAVGQSRLMMTWEGLFEIYGLLVGQMLLTRADVSDRDRFLNAQDMLRSLLEHRIIPVINENDAVATAEIKVGDNDNLSALVTLLAEADLLLMLTDRQGLYTADPRTHPEAQLIPEVQEIDDDLRRLAGGAGSDLGTGGMATKLEAAGIARRAGADVVIAGGREPDVILRAAAGDAVGTRFPALETSLESRKRWILAGAAPGGSITVDAGAARALREKGGSLLPAGITAVDGEFDRGDTVTIAGARGRSLARGIARYSAAELRRIAGCRSDQISDRLGYTSGPVAVHRDDMVVM